MDQLQGQLSYKPRLNLYTITSNSATSYTMSSQWLCGVFVVLALSCGAYGQGMNEEEKEEILKAHNYYRGQVDPVATNMLKMVRTQGLLLCVV